MLKDLLTWWSQQMLGLVPAWLLLRDDSGANALIVEPATEPDGLVLRRRRKRREALLGRFTAGAEGMRALAAAMARWRRTACVLRLGHSMLLERAVTLPLAAERDPERVLGYEMDRLTPFSAEEVFWTWAVIDRDRERNRLQLRLSLVPKAGLTALIAALERAGAPPTTIEVDAPDGAVRAIALQRAMRDQTWRRRGLALAGAFCAALAIAAAVLPFVLQSLARQRVEAEIAALRPTVQQAEALRRQIASRAAETDAVAAQRAQSGDPLAVLAAVTDILPDDTWLTELRLNQRRLALVGQSAAAARLIAALAADPTLRDPAFTAPVTRSETGRADLFSIRAEVAP